jgi:(1->4)-alpha-D-glucan 1-alpha-D-glucosylmutase
VQPDRAASTDDAARIDQAVGAARDAAPETDGELIDFIGQLLLLRWPGADEARFAAMFPQLSAPVMAKGVEDTAFYRYHRLVSLNEVGGDPGLFGRPLEEFHRGCAERATHLASSMLVLATHDTKRSPDVRARISLLAGMPERWEREVTRWFEMTDGHAGSAGPDYNTRYLMFQTLVGAWPIGADRLGAYMDKAAKEAKVHTSWAESDADYDYSLRKFVESTLADERFTGALESFLSETRLVEDGSAASLSQQTLLLTCPGIPDLYQGTEDWDRSLVDPDNRRPVDFGRLADKLAAASALGPAALADGQLTVSDDRAKVWLTARLLGHRRSRPDLYRDTGYEAVDVTGDRAGHVIAFRRGDLLVLATRFTTGLGAGWGDTTVALPARPGRLNAVVGPKPVPSTTGGRLAELLGAAPVAVYEL